MSLLRSSYMVITSIHCSSVCILSTQIYYFLTLFTFVRTSSLSLGRKVFLLFLPA